MEAATQVTTQQHAAISIKCLEDYRRFAALTIQRYYRGWIVRLHKSRQVRPCENEGFAGTRQ